MVETGESRTIPETQSDSHHLRPGSCESRPDPGAITLAAPGRSLSASGEPGLATVTFCRGHAITECHSCCHRPTIRRALCRSGRMTAGQADGRQGGMPAALWLTSSDLNPPFDAVQHAMLHYAMCPIPEEPLEQPHRGVASRRIPHSGKEAA